MRPNRSDTEGRVRGAASNGPSGPGCVDKGVTVMLRSVLVTIAAVCLGGMARDASAAAETAATAPRLSAAQIVEKNVAARGGLAAWRAVHTMIWKGKLGAGATTYEVVIHGKLQTKQRDEPDLPFSLEFKRPQMTRLEIQFNGQTAVQVFRLPVASPSLLPLPLEPTDFA